MDGFNDAQRAYDNALPDDPPPDLMGPEDGTEALDTRMVEGVEHRVYLEQDDDCENPREWGDYFAGRMVTAPNSRYIWPAEDGDTVSGAHVQMVVDDHDFRVVARWLRMFYGATVVLPLYSTGNEGRPAAGDASDTPNAGDYIGVTFDQPSTRSATGIELDDIPAALATEVDEFSAWAVGECFGYVIERATESGEWEQTGSLWGLVGTDYAQAQARHALGDVS